VVGEISRTPIGPWQGQEYRGEGMGTRHLLSHGMHTDYAVVADGSDLNIVWTQTGVVQVKITTFGKAEAAWGTKRSEYPMEKMNAIVKMTRIIAALEQWGEAFERQYVYDSPTGPLYPKVNIGAIEGGALSAKLLSRRLLDLRGRSHAAAVRLLTKKPEIEQRFSKLEIDYELNVYKYCLYHKGKNVEPLVECAQEAHEYLSGEKLKPEPPDRASIWTDTNIYNELGIPAIKIGPRGRRISARNEEIEIDAMMKAARLYALMALDICSRERKP
jgi:acetylornithine deacetylase/succinyl-diaminopimelate desuccinylase-like protein